MPQDLLPLPVSPSGERLAIIGSGASSIYLLKYLLDEAEVFSAHIRCISIFERSRITGMGMPYSPLTTDRYNMSNISSEELPELIISFADWLRGQDASLLTALDLEGVEIRDDAVYGRIALGQYLNSQYKIIISRLIAAGIEIHEHPGCEITDVRDQPARDCVILTTAEGEAREFDRVIIATGHSWAHEDSPRAGYYASPWPIAKLLPAEDGAHYDFPIGTLGASLSAFDVITSVAHRHGDFVQSPDGLSFHPHPGTEGFSITMHSAHGLLPHLQFDQDEPLRQIYRHIGRDDLLALVDDQGFLRLQTYFDKVCRPILSQAFAKDGLDELVALLARDDFGLREFVAKMTDTHDYANAFEGMRFEMKEAHQSVENHQPVHWKERIDDLMYTLNFHAELMPAEDHLLLKKLVMPFLMNVIAALPLESAETLLALYAAGKISLASGRVSVSEKNEDKGITTIIVEAEDGSEKTFHYRMFIDCSGQKPLELEDYPFASLVRDGSVRKARARFANPKHADDFEEEQKPHLLQDAGAPACHTGGVDIDGTYRLIEQGGIANPRLYDIAFPHVSGIRPYSYGLQACSDTSAILVQGWLKELRSGVAAKTSITGATRIYEKL